MYYLLLYIIISSIFIY